ncbi:MULTISPECIES: ABC transporter ATP-binding protein [Asticcacaulis]|uniref:ABC transporter ATP-binding protein n=1 Tax=Asticcacaulis TaxID=76890 RepID=UPI001AE2C86D|nr:MULTISPECIES: ABC transporter ATP-binding protein [Asticcacaulis]MBP2158352.1 lipoprotein-releasing system ATP-binding protein [Asticcacaulis solisilvae]MDR6799397.1 lipoprotein-releasing system ATP-binding protein [Asticcacaulis sp. BE141]
MSKPILSLRDLHRDYKVGEGRTLTVLNGVDLDIAAGEFVGLVGPSGSGKSSLLHAVGLLEAAPNARLTIDGQDFHSANEEQRTRARLEKIGFVYQFHHLLPEYTALGNVALPQRILGRGASEAEARARELLTTLGLGERLEHQPAQLSGGEQQRVAIARALANNPRLLLADEPTGNLDPDTSKQVFDALKAIVKAQGVGALIATHNLELARHMDRVVRLENGTLVPFTPEHVS